MYSVKLSVTQLFQQCFDRMVIIWLKQSFYTFGNSTLPTLQQRWWYHFTVDPLD